MNFGESIILKTIPLYELAAMAEKSKPGLIILYHTLFWGAQNRDLLDEIATIYKGKVVVGNDLDIY